MKCVSIGVSPLTVLVMYYLFPTDLDAEAEVKAEMGGRKQEIRTIANDLDSNVNKKARAPREFDIRYNDMHPGRQIHVIQT